MSALAEPRTQTVATFAVVAEATPGMLERIVAVIARGFPMPRKFTSVRHARADMLAVNIEMAALDEGRARLLAARLRGVVGVDKVFCATSGDNDR